MIIKLDNMMINFCAISKYIFLLSLFVASCKERNTKSALRIVNEKKQERPTTVGLDVNKAKLIERFSDSLLIGRKGLNKFDLERYAVGDSNYVVINFFTKQANQWVIRNKYRFSKDEVTDWDPNISDYNNDGLNDITYVSAIGAWGASDVRTLLVYDRKNDSLIFVKNSESFPNMLYNDELDCIDAFLVSGCNTTVFLKLEADSLREFASVDQCDSLTVTTYDKNGKEKIILKKPTVKDDVIRFKNYNPLKE